MDMNFTFDSTAKSDILGFFGKEVNEENIIVESSSKEPVIGLDGYEVYEKDFAGIKKGSEIFLKNDLLSMMKLADERR